MCSWEGFNFDVSGILCKTFDTGCLLRKEHGQAEEGPIFFGHLISISVGAFKNIYSNLSLLCHMHRPAWKTFNGLKCRGSCANFWSRMRATETPRARTARRRTNILCHLMSSSLIKTVWISCCMSIWLLFQHSLSLLKQRLTSSSVLVPVQTFGAGCVQQRRREQEQPEEGPTYSVTESPLISGLIEFIVAFTYDCSSSIRFLLSEKCQAYLSVLDPVQTVVQDACNRDTESKNNQKKDLYIIVLPPHFHQFFFTWF